MSSTSMPEKGQYNRWSTIYNSPDKGDSFNHCSALFTINRKGHVED